MTAKRNRIQADLTDDEHASLQRFMDNHLHLSQAEAIRRLLAVGLRAYVREPQRYQYVTRPLDALIEVRDEYGVTVGLHSKMINACRQVDRLSEQKGDAEGSKVMIWLDEWTLRRLHALAAIGPFGDTDHGVQAEVSGRLEQALQRASAPAEMEALIGALAPPEGTEMN